MKIVYRLADELKADPEQVELTQALTLDKSRPDMGLKGTFGLFASREWWDSIEQGKIATRRISGIIRRTYVAGQDECESDNSMELVLTDGTVVGESFYANNDGDLKLFQVGHKVDILYVLDELKRQPAPGGGVNYLQFPLEMAVSLEPVR